MLYVIDYTAGNRTEHGPYKSAQVQAIHTTIPHICPDTVSYLVRIDDDREETITVSMVHSIVPATEKNNS